MRAMLVLVLLVGSPILIGERARAIEQTIVPLTPPGEQQVVPLGPDEAQRVQGVNPAQDQAVGAKEPPSPGAKAASTVGKVVLGVLAAALSVAAIAAQLLFI